MTADEARTVSGRNRLASFGRRWDGVVDIVREHIQRDAESGSTKTMIPAWTMGVNDDIPGLLGHVVNTVIRPALEKDGYKVTAMGHCVTVSWE